MIKKLTFTYLVHFTNMLRDLVLLCTKQNEGTKILHHQNI